MPTFVASGRRLHASKLPAPRYCLDLALLAAARSLPEDLRHDPDFFYGVVQRWGSALRYAADWIRRDRAVVLAAIQKEWPAIESPPYSLLTKKDY